MDYDITREGADIWFVARLKRPDNVIVSQDDLATSGAFTVTAYQEHADVVSTQSSVFTETKTKAEVVSDSIITTATSSSALTNDGYWNGLDDEGYNFLYRATNANFGLLGGRRYRVEFTVATTAYGDVRWSQGVYVEPRFS